MSGSTPARVLPRTRPCEDRAPLEPAAEEQQPGHGERGEEEELRPRGQIDAQQPEQSQEHGGDPEEDEEEVGGDDRFGSQENGAEDDPDPPGHADTSR